MCKPAGKSAGFACVFQDFVEDTGKLLGALQVVGRSVIEFAFQQMKFVGDIEGREHSQASSVDGVSLLGDRAHLGIDVVGEFQDVFRVGAAQVIGLIENFHAHAGV